VPGAPDPRYLLARRILLDALEAIGEQRNAIVLVEDPDTIIESCVLLATDLLTALE
jgi:hypothetical protein